MRMDEHFTTEGFYRMLMNSKPGSDSYIEQYLFDLEADPYEKNNLVNDPKLKDIRAQLAQILCRCMERAGEKTPAIYPADTELPKQY